jgi:hypothetical protein
VYHFGVTLIATGIAAWCLYGLLSLTETLNQNYTQTRCNQGLLTLATLDVWIEEQLSYCRPELKKSLEEKYR